MIDDTTKIILSPEDVELFKQFMQHYQSFKLLQDNGVFRIGYGKAIINFAGNILQNITIEEIVWKK